MMKIKGSYTFRSGDNVILKGNNLITFFGESFILNRMINDNLKPISYIGLGNGRNVPQRTDSKLGNETIKKSCLTEADIENKKIILTTSFLSSEILGTTEIGVTNGDMLISHDVYERITSELLHSTVGEIQVEYIFQLQTSNIRGNWVQKVDDDFEGFNIFYVDEPNTVVGVYENSTKSGYKSCGCFECLKNNTGAYYYDENIKKLYIRHSRAEKGINPNDDMIYVETN